MLLILFSFITFEFVAKVQKICINILIYHIYLYKYFFLTIRLFYYIILREASSTMPKKYFHSLNGTFHHRDMNNKAHKLPEFMRLILYYN